MTTTAIIIYRYAVEVALAGNPQRNAALFSQRAHPGEVSTMRLTNFFQPYPPSSYDARNDILPTFYCYVLHLESNRKGLDKI